MARYFVCYYDGWGTKASIVDDISEKVTKPKGRKIDDVLQEAFDCDDIIINCIVNVPDDFFPSFVLVGDEQVIPKIIEA